MFGEKMTALYCYMVSFYDWSSSEFAPIFHEKKFTEEEFQEICNEIKLKVESNEDNKYDWEYPSTFLKYAKEYGFRDIDVLEVVTENFKVRTYGCF